MKKNTSIQKQPKMGNAQEPFQKRPIENVSEPMSDYINRCLEIYQQETGCNTINLWDHVYALLKIKLNTDTFKKIQQLDPILQKGLLTQSFGHKFQPMARFETGDDDSIKLLEYWNNNELFEKIHNLFEDKQLNNLLNFGLMKRVGTSVRIPFRCDDNMFLTIQCDS